MMARLFLALLFGMISNSLHAQSSFENSINQVLKKTDYKNATVGILIKEVNKENVIYSLNPEKLMIPASTMKLITTATALELLGEDYRFKTKIAYSGRIADGRKLNGDLVLVGGADPALGSEYFQDHYYHFLEEWAKQVKSAGIETVEGNLVLDASIYDKEKVPATWIWEDIGNYYGAGANAFTVYDNMFRITFRSPKKIGKVTTIISTYPKINGLKLENRVLSANDNRDNAYVFGSPLDKTREIRGTIPANREAFTIKAAIHNPGEILAADFQHELAKQGVFLKGEVIYQKVSDGNLNTIFIQESPSLAEITQVLNYESVNLFAEHFLKQIAVEINDVGNREEAIEIAKGYWKQRGVEPDIFVEDGSGLSHFNAVSPQFFVDLLQVMSDKPEFVNSLPGAGEGTLYHFDETRFPGRTLQAKSGSMTRVRCYSGYLETVSGKQLAFSIMFNHFSGSHSALISEIENMLIELKEAY